jgi:radical SAM protein with 4Fe4S-binding SPASM domain
MRTHERIRGLLKAPKLIWNAVARGRYAFVYDRIPMAFAAMPLPWRLNLARAGGNLVRRRLQPWSMPLHMQFELSSVCSLHCPVCPTGRHEVKRGTAFMEPVLFERVMEEVGPFLLTAALWGWGEPLLHPRLREILRVARAFPAARLLSTNGQKLAEAQVQEALRNEPPDHLIVAIDGITDESNARFRQGARLAPALDGVRQLAAWKRRSGSRLPILHMRFIVMKHNQHEVPLLDDFARGNGFDMLSLRTLSLIDHHTPDALVGDLVPGSPEWQAYRYRGRQRLRREDFVCQQPFWFPTLFADGTVVACEQDCHAQHPLGRVTERTSFREIWRSPRARAVRALLRDRSHEVSFCRNCPFVDREGTDCSVEAHFFNPGLDYANLAALRAHRMGP